MSSEAKEFIVSTEYPGYVFLGWATGKFETDRGQKMPYYNMYVLSQVSGYTSEDYQAEGMKAEKRNTCPPRSGTVWNPVTEWGVSKHRVNGSQRVKKEQYLRMRRAIAVFLESKTVVVLNKNSKYCLKIFQFSGKAPASPCQCWDIVDVVNICFPG